MERLDGIGFSQEKDKLFPCSLYQEENGEIWIKIVKQTDVIEFNRDRIRVTLITFTSNNKIVCDVEDFICDTVNIYLPKQYCKILQNFVDCESESESESETTEELEDLPELITTKRGWFSWLW